MSNSLQPHDLQHDRLPCPSLSPRVCSNSCPLKCHPTISPSVTPFSSCLQSFPASESLLMNWLFASSDQSIGASVNINEYLGLISLRIDWFNLLAVQGTFKSSPASKFEANIGRNYYIMVCIASHLQAFEYIGSVFPPCFL